MAVAFVRVEHVERVVARGLLDDEHEAGPGQHDRIAQEIPSRLYGIVFHLVVLS